MFPLSITMWVYAAVAAVVLGLSGAVWIQTARLDSVKKEFALFQAQAEVLGKEAERVAKVTKLKDIKNKEEIDAQNKVLRSANAVLNRRLRDARAGSSFVPPAPTGSPSPDRATINRVELDGALRQLDSGVSDLIEEGDKGIIDLNTAKAWAQRQ